MTTTPPEGLSAALLAAGLRLGGPVGLGGTGAPWSAVGPEGGRWTVTVVIPRSAEHRRRLRRRAETLRQVRHDHLPAVGDLLDLRGGGLALLCEEVLGTDLATISPVKGAWSAAEVVTVLVPVANAVAALHAAGLAHGDVSAGNVVVDPEGRAVLVDLLCGDDPAERGTAGLAAPERPDGAKPPGDVHAVAALGLLLLGGATGTTTTRRGDGGSPDDPRAAFERYLGEVVAAAPDRRPTVDVLAAEVYARCPPAPLELPDRAVLARAALRRLAEAAGAQRTERVVRPPRRGHGRHRRTRRTRALVVAALAVAVVGGSSLVVATDGGGLRSGEHRSSGQAGTSTDRLDRPGDPVTAAVLLTYARARALADGDAQALRAVTVPGSPAALADAGSVGGAHGRPGASAPHIEILGARLQPAVWIPGLRGGPVGPHPGSDGCAGCARVLLTARIGSGSVDDLQLARQVLLVLRPTSRGWLVSEVQAAP